MCRSSPDNLLDLIDKTHDPMELRAILKEICDCETCCDGDRSQPETEDSSCRSLRRVEFRNWLMYCMKIRDLSNTLWEDDESDSGFSEARYEPSPRKCDPLVKNRR